MGRQRPGARREPDLAVDQTRRCSKGYPRVLQRSLAGLCGRPERGRLGQDHGHRSHRSSNREIDSFQVVMERLREDRVPRPRLVGARRGDILQDLRVHRRRCDRVAVLTWGRRRPWQDPEDRRKGGQRGPQDRQADDRVDRQGVRLLVVWAHR